MCFKESRCGEPTYRRKNLGLKKDLPTVSGGTSGKEPTCQCRRHKRCRFDPWVRKIPWRSTWLPTPVFLPGESHGERSLVGYSPWVAKGQTGLSS